MIMGMDIVLGSPSTTFTITYKANGGTGRVADLTAYSPGASVTVMANSFTNEGYVFAGWNTTSDGSGTAYTEGDDLVLDASMVLYAQWIKQAGGKNPGKPGFGVPKTDPSQDPKVFTGGTSQGPGRAYLLMGVVIGTWLALSRKELAGCKTRRESRIRV